MATHKTRRRMLNRIERTERGERELIAEHEKWLKDRMESIKSLPPPTLEKVRRQFKASANAREHYEKTGEWNGS